MYLKVIMSACGISSYIAKCEFITVENSVYYKRVERSALFRETSKLSTTLIKFSFCQSVRN